MTDDVGLRLVDSLYEQLQIDDEWAVRRERGFTWWSYRLAQHVEVSPPVWSGDRHVCAVRIWTEIVRDVDTATGPAAVLGRLNAYALLSALVWDEADASITEWSTAVVHDENVDWLSKVLATAAVWQNSSAHSRAHPLATLSGGMPAVSEHPSSGERPEMDGMLGVPDEVVKPQGALPSRFVGAKIAGVADFLREMNFAGTADDTGLTCEVPFTGDTPSIALEPGQSRQTALVQLFAEVSHPDAGSGVLCLMRLPYEADPQTVAAQANWLNAQEAQANTGTQLLGAWCLHPQSETTLAFCCFVPNLLSEVMAVENLVAYLAGHSRFAAENLGQVGQGG
jgi:hypothetical protein